MAGEAVLPCEYFIERLDSFCEGRLQVQRENAGYGHVNELSRLCIPCQWTICLNRKYGFIERTGAYISPCQWTQASSYRNGYAIVQDENSLAGIIDREGRLTVPCAYASLQFLGDQGNPGIPQPDLLTIGLSPGQNCPGESFFLTTTPSAVPSAVGSGCAFPAWKCRTG